MVLPLYNHGLALFNTRNAAAGMPARQGKCRPPAAQNERLLQLASV
jgi:hypothetical protein